MKKCAVIFLILLCVNGYAQKATIRISVVDSTPKDPSKYIFKADIKNENFDHYWLQDTSYLAAHVQYPSTNLIYTILWKKIEGRYKEYEQFKHGAGQLRLKCMDSCCNCIFLDKGQSMSFKLKLLDCCNLTKGEYKMVAYLHPPISSCDSCEQLIEIESSSIYLKVK